MQGDGIATLPAIAAGALTLCGAALVSDIFGLVGSGFDFLQAKTPSGNKGTSGWVKSLREIKTELIQSGGGPYWGAFKNIPVFSEFVSNAMCIAPAGAGKTSGAVLTNCLSIRDDKILTDFKGEISCSVKQELEDRGEVFHALNLGGLWEDALGPSACYNPLDLIADHLECPGGLCDIVDDLRGMSAQLVPDPVKTGGSGDNKHFTEGERDLIAYGKLQNAILHHRRANLGEVCHMMNDVDALLKEAQWVCGRLVVNGQKQMMPIENLPWIQKHDPQEVANFIEYHRGTAAALCDLIEATDSRTFNSFLTGTRQALRPFNKTTRTHKVLSKSTLRFSDCKTSEETNTISIIADDSRSEAQKPVVGLLQYCAMIEIKRAENKKRPVYFIMDEATNFTIQNLPELLTFGRGYGLRLLLIFQSISAFVKAYGEEAFNILWSETEIKQFLPGQREPRVLKMISELLAEQTIKTKDYNGGRGRGVDGYGYREEASPLMTEDEIRRCKKTLLAIRDKKVMQVDLPPIAAIHPWRDQVGINPFYGKPFRLPIKLRIPRKFLKKRRRS
ncbi:MAG: type IV secretory system conjugative DNA transfer family protein [Pseudomonadota bacterium]